VWDNGVRHVDVKGGVGEIAGKHDEYAEGAQAGTQRGTILQIPVQGNECSDQKIQGNVHIKIQGNV
jgi:hypothetical protein